MNVKNIVLACLLVTNYGLFGSDFPGAFAVKKQCPCGPTEHWLAACCNNNYKNQYPDCGLSEKIDKDNLPVNIKEGIQGFSLNISFNDEKGNLIAPKVNDKGETILPIFKSPDFKIGQTLVKEIPVNNQLQACKITADLLSEFSSLKNQN